MTETLTNNVQPNKTTRKDAAVEPCQLLYISWAQSCSRSDQTARELGGLSKMVYLPIFGSHPLTILPKYLGQFFITLWLLIRYRPRVVMVMSPPIFAAFAPMLFCWITRRPFGLDCHTAAFKHPRFRRLQWLQAAIERRAAINIVHNQHLHDIVTSRGGKSIIVADVPVIYEVGGHEFELSENPNVVAVCSFNPDEPIEAIIEAARQTPEVQFYMTGNPKHLAESIKADLPANLQLTGFVSNEAYGSLIRNSDIVMSLTTRDHTMLRGAWEAIYQGTPVIVSDWPILQQAFNRGAIHVDNSAEGISAGIKTILGDKPKYETDVGNSRMQRIKRWQKIQETLKQSLKIID